jgi:hypothetical protein
MRLPPGAGQVKDLSLVLRKAVVRGQPGLADRDEDRAGAGRGRETRFRKRGNNVRLSKRWDRSLNCLRVRDRPGRRTDALPLDGG